jgi:hypothetical protein
MSGSTRVGDSHVVFGVTDDPHGFVKAEAVESAVEKQMATSQGNIKAVDYYNATQHVTGSYTYFNGVSGAYEKVGTGTVLVLVNCGLSIYVESATKNWEEAGYVNVSFDGYYYPNLGS